MLNINIPVKMSDNQYIYIFLLLKQDQIKCNKICRLFQFINSTKILNNISIINIIVITFDTMNLHHLHLHYHDIIMSMMVSQITGISIVCSTVGSGADQRKHQSAVSLAFVCGIQWWPVSSPHKRPVTRKMFPFYDVIMHLSGIIFFNKTLFVNTWQFVLTFACWVRTLSSNRAT